MNQAIRLDAGRADVLAVLRRRRAEGSRPGSRSAADTARLAVLVEGGGMRGVVSAAMLTALEDLGFKDSIDAVYGCSAGAMNAAYFLSTSETWFYLSIYFDHLSSREFVDLARALRGRDILNLEYAFEQVVTERMPLALRAVRESPISLRVMLSMADTATALGAFPFCSDDDLRQALLATCWLPIARRGLATFRGRPALDGGVLTPNLASAAQDDGFTHLLYLRTRPETGRVLGGRLFRLAVARHLDQLAPGLGAAYLRSESLDNDVPTAASVLHLRPSGSARVVSHEIRPEKLLLAARDAYARAVDLLEPETETPRVTVPRFMVHSARSALSTQGAQA